MKNIFIVSILIFFCSCNKQEKKSVRPNVTPPKLARNKIAKSTEKPIEIKIVPNNYFKYLNFDDYFELSKYIILDKKVIIGTIDKIEFTDDKIIISDTKNTEQIYCFDFEGNLLWEYKDKGGSPYEYIRLKDFDIDRSKNVLYLWDSRGLKVMEISLDDGSLIDTYKTHTFGMELVVYNDLFLFYDSDGGINESLQYKLLFFDKKNTVQSRNLPLSKFYLESNHVNTNSIYTNYSKDRILFNDIFNDTIYEIKDYVLTTKYILNYGKFGFDVEKTKGNASFNKVIQNLKKRDLIDTFVSDLIQFNDKLVFNYPFKINKSDEYSTLITCIYDEKNSSLLKYFQIKNTPLSLFSVEQIMFKTATQNELVQIVQPGFFDKARKELKDGLIKKDALDKFIKNKPNLHKLILETDEFSNPVLAFYKLK